MPLQDIKKKKTSISLQDGLTIASEIDWKNSYEGHTELVVEIAAGRGLYRFRASCVLSYDKENDALIIECEE